MDKSLELSIVAPMYNERDNIVGTLEEIKKAMHGAKFEWELIFVDDGSTDGSFKKAKKLEIQESYLKVIGYRTNMGRGRALREGFKHARGNYIITVDFDLSYSADQILNIYNKFKEDESVDAVLGSCYMEGGDVKGIGLVRHLISRLGNRVLGIVFPGNFHTTTCIFRGYKREIIQNIELESNRKDIHLEILSKLLALNSKIIEIPAKLTCRKKGKSKFKLRESVANHLAFTFFEKPILLFGLLGIICLVIGLILGLHIIYLRLAGLLNPDRPLIPITVILVLAGVQILSFGFIAMQIIMLRREVLINQKNIKMLQKRSLKNE